MGTFIPPTNTDKKDKHKIFDTSLFQQNVKKSHFASPQIRHCLFGIFITKYHMKTRKYI